MMTQIIIAASGAVLLAIVVLVIYLWKKKSKPENAPNTMILDEERGRRLEYIDWEDAPPGNPRRYKGGQYYLVKKARGKVSFTGCCSATIEDETGELHTFEYHNVEYIEVAPPKKLGILPESLYRALHDEVAQILFEMPASSWQKFGTIGMYLLIGGLAFLLLSLK